MSKRVLTCSAVFRCLYTCRDVSRDAKTCLQAWLKAREELRERAARRLQAISRGFLVRDDVADMRWSATIIQV